MKLKLEKLGKSSAKGPLIHITEKGKALVWQEVGSEVEVSEVEAHEIMSSRNKDFFKAVKNEPQEKKMSAPKNKMAKPKEVK